MCQTSGRKNCQNKKGRKTNCKSNKTIGKGLNKKAFYAASFVPKKKAASAVSRISQRKVFQGPQQVALRQRRNTFLHFNFAANVDDTLERIENVKNGIWKKRIWSVHFAPKASWSERAHRHGQIFRPELPSYARQLRRSVLRPVAAVSPSNEPTKHSDGELTIL